MPEPMVLAVDIGSSSVRASLYDSRLVSTASHQVRYRWHEHQDGRSELEPRRLERVVLRAVDGVLKGRRAAPVGAVAIAAFWHSLLGLDGGGHPTTPVMPWSDLRSDAAVAELRGRVSERRVHARTGCRLHASYWPARLHWFRRRQPAVFDRTVKWVGFGEWLQDRWLGRSAISISQASGTGFLHQDSCDWDPEILAVCGIDRAALSPIVDTTANDGALRKPLLERWPALRDARWLPVLGDGAINNVGAGCTRPGRAAIMIGTSGAVRMLWAPTRGRQPGIPFALWRYRLDRRRIVVGGALSNGGNVRDWILRTFRASGRSRPRRSRWSRTAMA